MYSTKRVEICFHLLCWRIHLCSGVFLIMRQAILRGSLKLDWSPTFIFRSTVDCSTFKWPTLLSKRYKTPYPFYSFFSSLTGKKVIETKFLTRLLYERQIYDVLTVVWSSGMARLNSSPRRCTQHVQDTLSISLIPAHYACCISLYCCPRHNSSSRSLLMLVLSHSDTHYLNRHMVRCGCQERSDQSRSSQGYMA